MYYNSSLSSKGVGASGDVPVFRVVSLTFLAAGIVIANSVVLLTYLRHQTVRKHVPNLIIFHLAVADFVVGCWILPLQVAENIKGRWVFGEVLCKIYLTVVYWITSMHAVIIICLTLQRRLAIAKQTKHRSLLGHVNVTIALVISWIVVLAFFIFVVFVWPVMTQTRNINYENDCAGEFRASLGFTIFLGIAYCALPCATLVALCVNLTRKLYLRSLVNRRVHALVELKDSSQSPVYSIELERGAQDPRNPRRKAPPIPATQAVSSRGNDNSRSTPIQGEEHVRDQETGRGLRRYLKAYVLLAVLVTFYLLSWLSVATYNSISFICASCDERSVKFYSDMVLFGNSLINPFLYAATNVHFRKGFTRVLDFPKRFCRRE
ncbi:histamine H3 receptor-like [Diadema antillarum]|uniref:histamine H3 receptor-like n=1 Tax=Diadema antillarum TaxID=105358 RepID=UPI003A8C0B15